MSRRLGCQLKPTKKWIELFPYGLTMGIDQQNPVLIFKDGKEALTLPVSVTPIEAHITLTENAIYSKDIPCHRVTLEILKELKMSLAEVYFTEIIGGRLFVELYFKGSKELKKLRFNSSEVMSFCLSQEAKYYVTPELVEESKYVQAELSENFRLLQSELQKNRHKYIN